MASVQKEKFWSEFIRKNWEKKPILMQDFADPIKAIDSQQIFAWLVQYSDYCRQIQKAEGLKFYIDGEAQFENEVLQALPIKKDRSLQGYHHRMSQIFSDYCLVCDELIQVSASQQTVIRKFMKNLYDRVGYPNRQTEIGLYLGNYKKTPFGVHVDGCGVFSFPVEGIKKFRLWTDSYAKKNPDLDRAFEYRRHLKKSTLITAQKGDMTYWPSTAWHIAESTGEFSATWSFGVWVDQPLVDVLHEALRPLMTSKLKDIGQLKAVPAVAKSHKPDLNHKLPVALQKAAEVISGFSPNEIHDLLMQSWLTGISKNGFKSALQMDLKIGLRLDSEVIVPKDNSITLSQLKNGSYCIAVHGRSFIVPKSQVSEKFFKQLRSPVPYKIRSLIPSSGTRSIYKEIVLALLQTKQMVFTSDLKLSK